MFDGKLCKLIGKKEVTVGDVVEYIVTYVGISMVITGALFIFSFFMGILTLICINPYLPTDYFPSAVELAAIGAGTIIWVTNVGIITFSIFSIKIAKYPNKQ